MLLKDIFPFIPSLLNMFGMGNQTQAVLGQAASPLAIQMLVTMYKETTDKATKDALATTLYLITGGSTDSLKPITDSATQMNKFREALDKV